MKLEVFSIFDAKAGAYGMPFFAFNEAVAQRMVAATLGNADSLIGKFPADYQLFHIGSFDDSVGVLKSIPPVVVCTVVSLREVVHAS